MLFCHSLFYLIKYLMNKSTPKSFTQRPKQRPAFIITIIFIKKIYLPPSKFQYSQNSQSLCVMLKERFLLKEVEIEDIALSSFLTFNSTSFSTHVRNLFCVQCGKCLILKNGHFLEGNNCWIEITVNCGTWETAVKLRNLW